MKIPISQRSKKLSLLSGTNGSFLNKSRNCKKKKKESLARFKMNLKIYIPFQVRFYVHRINESRWNSFLSILRKSREATDAPSKEKKSRSSL